MVKKILRYVALFGWMTVIFLFSNQSATESSELSDGLLFDILNFLNINAKTETVQLLTVLIRKTAHFSIYAVLGALACVAFCKNFSLTGKKRFFIPLAISAFYAVTDEVHQFFVPGRTCMALDVCIDSCGAMVGILAVLCVWHFINRRGRNG